MPNSRDQSRANLARRLATAQRDVGEKKDAYEAALELRKELIHQAIDAEGMTGREVAMALGLSQSRVQAILGSSAA